MATTIRNWRQASDALAALRRSEGFRGNATNAAYGVVDYVAQPLLMVAAAPFLVSHLGLNQYGIWMLVNAFAGTMGVVSMNLGDATVKYVSTYRGRQDPAGVSRVVSATFTISLLLGSLAALLTFFAAPMLVQHAFKIEANLHKTAIQAIQLGGIVLVLRSLESVFVGTLRAHEQYAIPTKVAVLVRTLIVVASVVLVALGFQVVGIMMMTVLLTGLGLILQARAARRIAPSLSLWPKIEASAWKEVCGFGIYTWIQNFASVIFSQADRLLIAALLGTAPVAYYTICVQLAQPVHGFASAGFNFLFPHISARYEAGDRKGSGRVYRRAVLLSIFLASALCLPLVVFGRKILTLWMGAAFAEQSYLLLVILAVGFAILSINVVPHYTLLGLGKVRFVSVVNVLGGALTLLGSAVLIPSIGLVGAGIGRLMYGPVITLNFWKVAKDL